MEVERALNPQMSSEFFNQKSSFLARLGSGSACRSIEGDLVQWGNHNDTGGSSDLFAIKYPYAVHEIFKNYHDTILLVDKGQKQVSSTVGHDLMHNHPFAKRRFDQAHENLTNLKSIFAEGNLKSFIEIVESEALTLDAGANVHVLYPEKEKEEVYQFIRNELVVFCENGQYLCDRIGLGARKL